jgi:hypothetical protein
MPWVPGMRLDDGLEGAARLGSTGMQDLPPATGGAASRRALTRLIESASRAAP